MEIHAQAKYDKRTLKRFALVPVMQKKILNIILSVFFALVIAFLLVIVIFLDELLSELIIFSVLVAFYYCYLFLILPNLVYKQSKRISDSVNSYVFTESRFCATSSGEGISGSGEIEYTSLFKAVETKEFLYLYLSKGQAMIVDKSSLTEADAESLRQTIMFALGKKYKII